MPTLGATSSKSADALRFSLPVKIEPRPNPKRTSQFNEIRTAFLEELYDTKAGVKQSFILGTNLTRNLGITPEDVESAAEAVKRHDSIRLANDGKSTEAEQGKVSPPFSAYVLLFVAVMGLASCGPLLNMQPNVNSLLKVYWRMTCYLDAHATILHLLHSETWPPVTHVRTMDSLSIDDHVLRPLLYILCPGPRQNIS